MAQHVNIENLRQKVFKRILEGIKKDFQSNKYLGSLKYQKEHSNFYSENENDEVFFANRYIGKGIVYGSSRGDFEIHHNKETRETIIYLVA
jgi:hypothetical protein